MAVRIVRLGSERKAGEGLRIGTVRRPPRGVPRTIPSRGERFSANLAPSEALLKQYFPIADEKQWRSFQRRFLAEMKAAGPARDLDLLAALSHQTSFSIGCYCEDESLCHRSLLRMLLETRQADLE